MDATHLVDATHARIEYLCEKMVISGPLQLEVPRNHFHVLLAVLQRVPIIGRPGDTTVRPDVLFFRKCVSPVLSWCHAVILRGFIEVVRVFTMCKAWIYRTVYR